MTLNNSNRDSNRSSPTICASNACPYNKQSNNTINKNFGQITVPETNYLLSREQTDIPAVVQY